MNLEETLMRLVLDLDLLVAVVSGESCKTGMKLEHLVNIFDGTITTSSRLNGLSIKEPCTMMLCPWCIVGISILVGTPRLATGLNIETYYLVHTCTQAPDICIINI